MTELTHLSEERAEWFVGALETAMSKMGTNEPPFDVTYRLNVAGMTGQGQVSVTEFRVEGFTSFYAEDIPDLLRDDEYIASMGVHLDTEAATLSIVTEKTNPEGNIFV